MKKFLRAQDNLGASPQMSYKKSSTFGTSLGGCCSIIFNIIFGLYISSMLFGFFAHKEYDQQSRELYLSPMDNVTYILTSNEFIPVVKINSTSSID